MGEKKTRINKDVLLYIKTKFKSYSRFCAITGTDGTKFSKARQYGCDPNYAIMIKKKAQGTPDSRLDGEVSEEMIKEAYEKIEEKGANVVQRESGVPAAVISRLHKAKYIGKDVQRLFNYLGVEC